MGPWKAARQGHQERPGARGPGHFCAICWVQKVSVAGWGIGDPEVSERVDRKTAQLKTWDESGFAADG